MSNITYTNQNGRKRGGRRLWEVDVWLDGKRVGEIRSVASGYCYKPEGSRKAGPVFPTMEAVKADIEGRPGAPGEPHEVLASEGGYEATRGYSPAVEAALIGGK